VKDLKELKAKMLDAHPDKGGSHEAFISARAAYVKEKAHIQMLRERGLIGDLPDDPRPCYYCGNKFLLSNLTYLGDGRFYACKSCLNKPRTKDPHRRN